MVGDGFMFMLGVVGALVYAVAMLALLVVAWSWGRDRLDGERPTASQKGEPANPHAANFREAVDRIDRLPASERSAMDNRRQKGQPSDG